MFSPFIRTLLFFFFLLSSSVLSAPLHSRHREARGVWIATVASIDWPQNRADSWAQRRQLTGILDSLKAININTVAFQVRPTADAFYKSYLEPWSHYLSGKQGRAPQPEYDPLQFLLDEAHKRCMEVHVWINPYRMLNTDKVKTLSKDHIFFRQPDMFKLYDGKYYFDPALQDTRDYLVMIVMDLVLRYDLDAIHMDDYFYPYKVPGKDFPDEDSFRKYPRGFKKKADWRRDNINLVIEQLQKSIKSAKPWVQFGISPFGQYQTDYSELYADITLWIQHGWIDYVAPQLYWPIGHRLNDYAKLYDWWADHSENPFYKTNFYTGLYAAGLEIYSQKVWQRPNELCRQMRLNLREDRDCGQFFYSCHHLLHNPQGLLDSLQNRFYTLPALPPVCPSIPGLPSPAPFNVNLKNKVLSWNAVRAERGMAVRYYVVYVIKKSQMSSPNLAPADVPILTVTASTSINLIPFLSKLHKGDFLAVTSFNCFRQESDFSSFVSF